jgi:hypothetical protein
MKHCMLIMLMYLKKKKPKPYPNFEIFRFFRFITKKTPKHRFFQNPSFTKGNKALCAFLYLVLRTVLSRPTRPSSVHQRSYAYSYHMPASCNGNFRMFTLTSHIIVYGHVPGPEEL